MAVVREGLLDTHRRHQWLKLIPGEHFKQYVFVNLDLGLKAGQHGIIGYHLLIYKSLLWLIGPPMPDGLL